MVDEVDQIMAMIQSPPAIVIQFQKKMDPNFEGEVIQIPDIETKLLDFNREGTNLVMQNNFIDGIYNLR